MTIKWYATSDELTGTDPLGRKAGRFELLMATRLSSNSRPVFRKCEFTVTGTTDAAVDAAAIQIAEEILAMSAAKGQKFSKVLGHYRQDEQIPVLAVNQKSLAIVGYSPDPGDDLEAVNLKLYIPHFTGAVADAQNLVGLRTAGGGSACLGYVRWQDQEETNLEAMYGEYYRGVNIIDMETLWNEPFTTTNVSNGVADEVLGPKV